MSRRELERVGVLARVRSKQLLLVDAGRLMRVSYRQAKRLWKRYREEGAAGLKHRGAGRPSNCAHEQDFRRKVLQLIREKYGGAEGERFGPTLAAEHLASEDGLPMAAETLRQWMLAAGLWSRERRRRPHRRRRERKEHFGELVQMDGSFHAWLEERGPEGCLIDMVDDATNTTWAQLGEQETIWAAADALRAWIERYGVPLALYVDWKNLYKRAATAQERLRGEQPITQFGRMCAKLGIELIAASSPQAHRRAPRAAELDRIFRLENERMVSDDWVVRCDNRFFQLQRHGRHYPPTQGKVLVGEGRHGQITIEYRGRALSWQEIPAPAKPRVPPVAPKTVQSQRKRIPSSHHPWREPFSRAEQKRQREGATPQAHPRLAWPSASP